MLVVVLVGDDAVEGAVVVAVIIVELCPRTAELSMNIELLAGMEFSLVEKHPL